MTDLNFTIPNLILTKEILPEGLISHIQVPTTVLINQNIRIYFASRDTLGETNIYFVDVDSINPEKIVGRFKGPILEKGNIGFFIIFITVVGAEGVHLLTQILQA